MLIMFLSPVSANVSFVVLRQTLMYSRLALNPCVVEDALEFLIFLLTQFL